MPRRVVKLAKTASNTSLSDAPPSPPTQQLARRVGKPTSKSNGIVTSRMSSSSPTKIKPVSKKKLPPPVIASPSSVSKDEYDDEVLALESSSGEDSDDVFDPELVDSGDSARLKKSNNRDGTSSAAAAASDTDESDLAMDEGDHEIGNNYHTSPAKSPSKAHVTEDEESEDGPVVPAKKRKSLPKRTGITRSRVNGKNAKRKRDDYSDAAPSNEGEDEMEVERKPRRSSNGKATSGSPQKVRQKSLKKTPAVPAKKSKKDSIPEAADTSDDDEGGTTIIGTVVHAPKSGRVPPGQISQNTLNFLSQLAIPECNDREWFRLHEPVYRLAEQEWKDFTTAFNVVLAETDDEIPILPPKDFIHRIYRDVRFSNDKTPYKRNFSASFSRAGRSGKFAGYHVSVRPGGTILAGGIWCPQKDELAAFRANLLANPSALRAVIEAPAFVELFGTAKPHPKKQKRNVFGHEDELKVAPKGVKKDHPDIDLLKLRSVAVSHTFADKQVLRPDFRDEVARVAGVIRPLVRLLNDMLQMPENGDSD